MKDKTQSIGYSVYSCIVFLILLLFDIFMLKDRIAEGNGLLDREVQLHCHGIIFCLSVLIYIPREIIIRLKMRELTANSVNWMEHPKDVLDENLWYRENESLSLWLIMVPIIYGALVIMFGSFLAVMNAVHNHSLEGSGLLLPYAVIVLGIVGIGVELWRLNRRKKALASVEKEND